MTRFRDLREAAQTFLVYQSSQPGGLPTSKRVLEQCYELYLTIHPSPIAFPHILTVLHRTGFVRSRRAEDEMVYANLRRIIPTSTSHEGPYYCEHCKLNCTDAAQFDAHVRGVRHKAVLGARIVNGVREESEMDKGGISITTIEFETVMLGAHVSKTITISNTGNFEQILQSCVMVKKTPNLRISDEYGVVERGIQFCMGPRCRLTMNISFDADNLGWVRDILVFKFSNDIIIQRYLSIKVDAPGSQELEPVAPYVRPPTPEPPPSEYIRGPKVQKPPTTAGFARIDKYDIPYWMKEQLRNELPPYIPRLLPLPEFYIKFFATLLHCEEYQMSKDIRNYDRWDKLQRNGSYYILKVPGLAENRPSVLKGDSVFVFVEGQEYEGVVHVIEQEEVQLKFHPRFNIVDGETYRIRFSFKRTPLRRMHRAVNSVTYLPPGLLFPLEMNERLEHIDNLVILDCAADMNPIDRNLNTQQKRAVAAILRKCCRPNPYVVFGPPGTGKTKTIVEAIGQIYLQSAKVAPQTPVRILACAPSNTAADVIAERLYGTHGVVQRRHILRFNAFNRPHDRNLEKINEISTYNARTGNYDIPSKQVLEGYHIIVSTCMNAGYLTSLGVKEFDYIFVDEAGQALEPECLVCLSGMVGKQTCVVLAGDHQQLGPIVRSPHATLDSHGLGRSFLERILSTPLYQHDAVKYSLYANYDVRLITKLVDNYRSHPEILHLPNELFYHGELKAMADVILRQMMCNWDGLARRGFPIMFHGIEGDDEREQSSPSWFNVSEILQVSHYINKLRECRAPRVNLPEIGVITPYRKQAQKIRQHLIGRQMGSVKVGSVEEFQGQEREIIIISCVRSSKEHLAFDLKHNLGFLKNPKRFNVAITRAKALLIVIGNPHVLIHDKHWARLLQHCITNGAYVGCPPPRGGGGGGGGGGEVDQLADLFDRLNVTPETGISLVEGREGPEWRTY